MSRGRNVVPTNNELFLNLYKYHIFFIIINYDKQWRNICFSGKSTPVKCLHIGHDLIFGRLWKELGIEETINRVLKDHKYQFDVERAIYHTVMHRLFESGSDRSSLIWKEDVRLYGTEEIELQPFYEIGNGIFRYNKRLL